MTALLRRALAILAMLLVLVAGFTAPASAHDSIASSDPRDGQNIAPGHRGFVLTFSDKIQTFGAEMVLEDSTGKRTTLTPSIRKDQMRADASADLPEGNGTLRWRAVSADGHPIDGIITFNVLDPSKPRPSGAPVPSVTATASEAAAPAEQPSGTINKPLLFLGAFALVSGLIGGILGTRMRRKGE